MHGSSERFSILTTAASAGGSPSVLKHGDTFALFDRLGDVRGDHGLFHQDTRFLSYLRLRLGGERPLVLSSVALDNNSRLTVDMTNGDLEVDGVHLPHGALHLFRSKFVWNAVCYERLRISSFAETAARLELHVDFAADFADIFEVRGHERARRGRVLPPVCDQAGVLLAYEGLDGRVRSLRIACSPVPASVREHSVSFELVLAPRQEQTLFLSYACDIGGARALRVSRTDYLRASSELAARNDVRHETEISTSSPEFNALVERSRGDLKMMTTDTQYGVYPYAGVPWYSTVFGRDGVITALEMLWLDPSIASGVLRYLGATQSTRDDPGRCAEPGKVLHERRLGEMATLGEVPFDRYYGTVDATPLYVVLAGAYYDTTGDRALVEELWPSLRQALAWNDRYGDCDGDGFVEYLPHRGGLTHQGWKDSTNAVFHADGSDALGPIALCEVQGYVYAARRAGAALARLLGDTGYALELEHAAEQLRVRFEETFWCDELGCYALALDGEKRPCRVRSSNAGQTLFTGIVAPERARRLGKLLLGEGFFSGFGIRTVSSGERRYNPMSYHNGSVWPHDNALIARGLSRYGMKAQALELLSGLYDASAFFDARRLPELFCGFPRRRGQGPTQYPVACSPQAWASAAVFQLLQAALGLTVDAPGRRLVFSHPAMPTFLNELHIRDLRVGDASVDLSVHRYPDDVGINVVRRHGQVEVVNVK